ncbi:TPA: hypothetical protein PNO69_004493 [Salmonella enterica]|nr:hypothetical protein [Salmonella enterica]HCH9607936.1 hypothetical protein [Salmonella enterica]HDI5000230.1 hypothetical protein [Salmonella enterica]HDI5005051.1 hypothetical protein [Salmonella enterica]
MLSTEFNIIEDDNFLDKEVSELVRCDFYLFHIDENDGVYFYKDGVIWNGKYNEDGFELSDNVEYTSGTLNMYIDKLK